MSEETQPRLWVKPRGRDTMSILIIGAVVGISVGIATGSWFWGAVIGAVIVLVLVACDGFLDAILVEYNRTDGKE